MKADRDNTRRQVQLLVSWQGTVQGRIEGKHERFDDLFATDRLEMPTAIERTGGSSINTSKGTPADSVFL
jgi:hypothetical protein